MKAMLLAAWRFRFFIISSIKTDLYAKFARNRLGGIWLILNPLAQVVIFVFILSSVLSARLPGINNQYAYAIYLMAGTLGWSLFSEIVNRCLTLFIDNGNILKKLVFPKVALPLIVTGSALVNNVLLFGAILGIFSLLGHMPGMAVGYLPILCIVTVSLALGLGLILGVLNVFMRDIGQVVPVVMQFFYWLTPIVYTADVLPSPYRDWLGINPMMPVITGYQNTLLYDRAPDWDGLIKVGLLSIALLIMSLWILRKAAPEMVDQL